jgi:hypothetical protein
MTDFTEKYNSSSIDVEIQKRKIDLKHFLLWFIATSTIPIGTDEKERIQIHGESYTLNNAIGELTKVANTYTKPKIWPRRIKSSLEGYETMDNIVYYKEKY